MTVNETILQAALSAVLPTYHLMINGRPEIAAAYRTTGERHIYESNIPILSYEIFEVYIYQMEYDGAVVSAVRAAAEQAGFNIIMTGQVMEDEYYRDELRMEKRKQED